MVLPAIGVRDLRTLDNLERSLDELLVADQLADQRRATRTHYLGPFAPEGYAEAFVSAARQIVRQPTKKPARGIATSEPSESAGGMS